jgi:hypothetical protein
MMKADNVDSVSLEALMISVGRQRKLNGFANQHGLGSRIARS